MNVLDIENDKFLKNLKEKELNELAEDIRSFIVSKVSKNGGHLSSNLGDVELIMAIHKIFDLDNDKLLFDVGHQAYTHKILTGRAIKFDSLRNYNGLAPFLDSSESKYDIFESGHSSTSISTAMGMAKARDDNNEKYNVISFIGDASIANGVAFEALNNLANLNSKIIIILNDNDMSINKSVGTLAKGLSKIRISNKYNSAKTWFYKFMHKTKKIGPAIYNFLSRIKRRIALILRSDNLFDKFNISYLGPIDGHNFKQLEKALKKAKNYNRSILVHVKTIKGKGYKFAEDDYNGYYHGLSNFNIENGIENKDNNTISFSEVIANKIYNTLLNNKDAYLINPAMISGSCLNKCFEDFKDRCIDVGIAEEHAICFANGLALNDKKPIVSIYSTFLQRGYDELVHDICRVNSNVMFVIDRAGLVGKDGKTHQGNLDLSFIYPLENSIIAQASRPSLANSLFDSLYNVNGSKFLRIQKENVNKDYIDEPVEFGKFIFEKYNKDNKLSIIAVGTSLEKIKILLKDMPINIINPCFLKPLDLEALKLISNTEVIIYDNTSIYDGFTSNVCKYLNDFKCNISTYTLPDKYISHGSINDLLKSLNLDENSIYKIIKDKLNGKN